jgi:hypothetical protein
VQFSKTVELHDKIGNSASFISPHLARPEWEGKLKE